MREELASGARRWRRRLERDARAAVDAGDLPPDTDPTQLATDLNGVMLSLNHDLMLLRDRKAPARARRAMRRLLT